MRPRDNRVYQPEEHQHQARQRRVLRKRAEDHKEHRGDKKNEREREICIKHQNTKTPNAMPKLPMQLPACICRKWNWNWPGIFHVISETRSGGSLRSTRNIGSTCLSAALAVLPASRKLPLLFPGPSITTPGPASHPSSLMGLRSPMVQDIIELSSLSGSFVIAARP